MRAILFALLAVLLLGSTSYAAGPRPSQPTTTYEEPKHPFNVPEVEELSDYFGEAFAYVCIDGYVFVLRVRGGLAQLIERDEDGLPGPVRCPRTKKENVE